MGKRIRSLPALFDLDVRKKIVDGHKDYQQILSYPQPPIERFAKTPQDIDEFCRIINDGFAELIAKEKDHFPGWVAQVSLAAPDAGVGEAERALKNGALGVQIYTNVAGKPIDRPEYAPFWKKMNELGAPIWMHPARGAETPDYLDEKKSLYEIWWTIGWSYETAAAMLRLVYSKIMDNHPNLKIITHHFAGIVPMLEGRLGPGNDVMGQSHHRRGLCRAAQEPEEAPARLLQAGFLGRYRGLHRRAGHQMPAWSSFPIDKIVFASDCPFDPEGGTMYPRVTLEILDSLKMDKATSEKVFYKNLEAVTGKKLVK